MEEKKAEEHKKDIIENKKDTTTTVNEYKNLVDITKNKDELQSVIQNTNKLTEQDKQKLLTQLQNVTTQEQLKEVKELAKTGETTTLLTTILGLLGITGSVVLKRFKL